MTAAAKLIIVGHSTEVMLSELAKIKAWQKGHDWDIHVHISDNLFFRDSIENVEKAINGDLQEYIAKNLPDKRYTTKTDGHSIVQLIDNPDYHSEEGHYKNPHRKHARNYTPPKKRRK